MVEYTTPLITRVDLLNTPYDLVSCRVPWSTLLMLSWDDLAQYEPKMSFSTFCLCWKPLLASACRPGLPHYPSSKQLRDFDAAQGIEYCCVYPARPSSKIEPRGFLPRSHPNLGPLRRRVPICHLVQLDFIASVHHGSISGDLSARKEVFTASEVEACMICSVPIGGACKDAKDGAIQPASHSDARCPRWFVPDSFGPASHNYFPQLHQRTTRMTWRQRALARHRAGRRGAPSLHMCRPDSPRMLMFVPQPHHRAPRSNHLWRGTPRIVVGS